MWIGALRRTITINSPIGSNTNVPGNPDAGTTIPATIGPKKNPAFPPERKTPIVSPLEGLLDLTTAEKAGGWNAAAPNPAVATRKRRMA